MKRITDIILTLILAVAFMPVIAVTALMVFFAMGWPLVFVQRRAGRKGREFRLLKWRSMTNATDAAGVLLPDEARLTPTGRLIRRVRVDELPSIINILRGDISFVGPRPLPPTNPINQAMGQARLAVRPGLTGLAQISGNTQLSDDEKLAIDLYYIKTQSFSGDLMIIWRTVLTLLHGERRNEAMIRQAVQYKAQLA